MKGMTEKELSEIRKIAYGLWEQEGRPDGQDRRHWDTAKEIWAFRHSGEDAPSAQAQAATSPRSQDTGKSRGQPGQASRRSAPA
jgi:hypothetical protein